MENGNAFKAFLAETAVTLNQLDIASYYAVPLPDGVDETLREVCGRFQQASTAQRQQFLDALTQRQQSLFGIFGHRAATLAARLEDVDWLRDGLVGNVISNATTPSRRSEAHSMAVYHHVARKLGLVPGVVFAEAAAFAPDDLAQRMVQFGQRTDVVLRYFGWQEVKTPDGIRYKFDRR